MMTRDYAAPDWRDLCEQLVAELERCRPLAEVPDCLTRARAALAQPEPEVVGPMQLPEQAPDERPPSNLDRREIAAWYHGHGCGWQAARAVLARWGRPAPAPAGERQATPVPVAVSERLPGPDDCAPWPGEPNAGRWCWMASCVDNGWAWEQRTLGFLASFPQDFTHWLPAHALPLPSGEVEA